MSGPLAPSAATPPEPRKRKRLVVGVVIGAVAALIVAGIATVVMVVLLGNRGPSPAEQVEAFYTALSERDGEAAYAALSLEADPTAVEALALASAVPQLGGEPVEAISEDETSASVLATQTDGDEVEFTFNKVEDAWVLTSPTASAIKWVGGIEVNLGESAARPGEFLPGTYEFVTPATALLEESRTSIELTFGGEPMLAPRIRLSDGFAAAAQSALDEAFAACLTDGGECWNLVAKETYRCAGGDPFDCYSDVTMTVTKPLTLVPDSKDWKVPGVSLQMEVRPATITVEGTNINGGNRYPYTGGQFPTYDLDDEVTFRFVGDTLEVVLPGAR